jgi:DivIVA domain-containing protein
MATLDSVDSDAGWQDGGSPEPADLRSVRFTKRFPGYDPEQVQRLLRRAADRMEELTRQREAAGEELGWALRELANADRRIGELSADGPAEPEPVRDAREVASQIIADAERRREALEREIERLSVVQNELHAGYRAFLLAALEVLETSGPAASDVPEQAS